MLRIWRMRLPQRTALLGGIVITERALKGGVEEVVRVEAVAGLSWFGGLAGILVRLGATLLGLLFTPAVPCAQHSVPILNDVHSSLPTVAFIVVEKLRRIDPVSVLVTILAHLIYAGRSQCPLLIALLLRITYIINISRCIVTYIILLPLCLGFLAILSRLLRHCGATTMQRSLTPIEVMHHNVPASNELLYAARDGPR